MSLILTKAKEAYVAARGYHTNRKLVCIESDDWGSIRMPSKQTFDKLISLGDNPQDDAFLSNDCLECQNDLDALFEVLSGVSDRWGRPAVITANFAVANPDFDRIDYKYGIYEYEPFLRTYERYYPNGNIKGIIDEGVKEKVFVPQLHCREHLNVNRWMQDLGTHKKDTCLAFDNKMIGTGTSFSQDNPFGYMDAFNANWTTEPELEKIVDDAAKIFCDAFGYESKTFVASCFVWNASLERILREKGLIGIQTAEWQNLPRKTANGYGYRRVLHYAGQKNREGQVYSVRNCSFEPAITNDPEASEEKCFREVARAFAVGKPAVINSHRLNYISCINPDNAKKNLASLTKLLNRIVETYDDAEFISSDNLIEIMLKELR